MFECQIDDGSWTKYNPGVAATLQAAWVDRLPSVLFGHELTHEFIFSSPMIQVNISTKTKRLVRFTSQWDWESDNGTWEAFPTAAAKDLHSALIKGEDTCQLLLPSGKYAVNLHQGIQKNLQTGKERDVRIHPWAAVRWQALGGTCEYSSEEDYKIWKAIVLQQESVEFEARGYRYVLELSPEWRQLNTNTKQVRGLQLLPLSDASLSGASPRRTEPGASPNRSDAAGGASHSRPSLGAFLRHSDIDHIIRQDERIASSPSRPFEPRRQTSSETAKPGGDFGDVPDPGSPKSARTKPSTSEGFRKKERRDSEAFKSEPTSPTAGGRRDAGRAKPGAGLDATERLLPEKVRNQLPANDRARQAALQLAQHIQGIPGSERKKCFKEMQFEWHPDKNPDDEEMATAVFQFLMSARAWFLNA